ncbi:hypothetical protein B0H11DRAFT_2232079 [Mycena galericulata]|nr:hypothetical protein B0H11DRAFT_2232079 [Mycena galericulata]
MFRIGKLIKCSSAASRHSVLRCSGFDSYSGGALDKIATDYAPASLTPTVVEGLVQRPRSEVQAQVLVPGLVEDAVETVWNTEDDGDVDVEDEINTVMERLAFGDFDDIPSDQDEGGDGDDQIPAPSRDPEIPPAAGPSRQHRTVQFADGPPEVQVFQVEEEQEPEEPASAGRRRSSRQAEHGGKGKRRA